MRRLLILAATSVFCFGGASAQQPSPVDLQKQLDAGKRAKEQKEGARREQSAHSGRLVVESDASCELRINGKRKQVLRAGEPATIEVAVGEQLIDCFSAEDRSIKVREKREVKAGAQLVVTLNMASEIRQQAAARRTEQEAARLAEEERAACERKAAMIVLQQRGGVLKHCGSSVEWTQSDNGRNVNWSDAEGYCRSKGAGWGLPTVAELQALYDRSGALGTQCGSSTCNVLPLFRLTMRWFWSSQREGPSRAWLVNLNNSNRLALDVGFADGTRALCVRRP